MSSLPPTDSYPVVALMTDFGTGDGDVGVMKGVIVGITPVVHMIDITHDIAPQNIISAAWILASAYRYFPANTVFVCVIDPGVGSARRAIGVHAGDWYFVGPDNGLFSFIYVEQPIHEAVVLSNPAYQLPQVSATFHGRDIFAPAGAYLAQGVPLPKLGEQLDPTTLERVESGQPIPRGTDIDAEIVHVDHFGNLITSIPLTMVPNLLSSPGRKMIFPAQGIVIDQSRRFFAEGPVDGQPFIYGDSSGFVGVAVRNGNAAHTLGVGTGTRMTLVLGTK